MGMLYWWVRQRGCEHGKTRAAIQSDTNTIPGRNTRMFSIYFLWYRYWKQASSTANQKLGFSKEAGPKSSHTLSQHGVTDCCHRRYSKPSCHPVQWFAWLRADVVRPLVFNYQTKAESCISKWKAGTWLDLLPYPAFAIIILGMRKKKILPIWLTFPHPQAPELKPLKIFLKSHSFKCQGLKCRPTALAFFFSMSPKMSLSISGGYSRYPTQETTPVAQSAVGWLHLPYRIHSHIKRETQRNRFNQVLLVHSPASKSPFLHKAAFLVPVSPRGSTEATRQKPKCLLPKMTASSLVLSYLKFAPVFVSMLEAHCCCYATQKGSFKKNPSTQTTSPTCNKTRGQPPTSRMSQTHSAWVQLSCSQTSFGERAWAQAEKMALPES